MRLAICWGGPLDKKSHAVFNRPVFSVPGDTYQLVRITYRDRPMLTIYECSLWLAKSFDASKLDGAPIIALYRERNLPFTSEVVAADAPCWPRKECPECNGRGKIEDGYQVVMQDCEQCDGTGKVLL